MAEYDWPIIAFKDCVSLDLDDSYYVFVILNKYDFYFSCSWTKDIQLWLHANYILKNYSFLRVLLFVYIYKVIRIHIYVYLYKPVIVIVYISSFVQGY